MNGETMTHSEVLPRAMARCLTTLKDSREAHRAGHDEMGCLCSLRPAMYQQIAASEPLFNLLNMYSRHRRGNDFKKENKWHSVNRKNQTRWMAI